MLNQTSRGRSRPLFDPQALHAFGSFAVERRDGAAVFRGEYSDPFGTLRTSRRFVEIVLDARGEWRGRNGIKFLESRAAWRPLNNADSRLNAIAFAQHAVERVRQQASEQISALHVIEQSIARSV